MIKKLITLVEWAKDYHRKTPYDVVHDIDHHKSVVKNCNLIIRKENLLNKVDVEAIEIAAWWHDVARKDISENAKLLRKVSERFGVRREFVEKIVRIIKNHTYGKSQKSSEEKVLFDADKLEYLSYKRGIKLEEAVASGKMPKEDLKKYQTAWEERIIEVRKNLHFKSSRKIFDQRFFGIGRKLDKLHGQKGYWQVWYNVYHQFKDSFKHAYH